MLKAVEVTTKSEIEEFLNFPAHLHQKFSAYIRPLDEDIEAVFDPAKNKLFREGHCQRYLFVNDKQETVGKVAVFINPQYQQEQPTGGIGFFDCIDDQDTANFILDFCKNWHQQKGMAAMDGPINFGERDRFWGLLVEGFHEPLYGMHFHPPYYKALFENYGFKVYFNQLCFSRPIFADVSRAFTLMHKKHSRNPNITARPMKRNQLEKFARDFTEVYNKAWASHGEGKQMEYAKTLKMFRQMKSVINDHISWFVYDKEQPIAMWMNIADLNQWFKYLNGKLGLWEKLIFLWMKNFKKNKKMVGLVFGVVPEWQRTGIEGYMIWEGTQHFRKHTDFEDYEMQWIGDFNPKMIKIAETLDTTMTRKLSTYRYLFDRNQEFKRHPEI